MEEKDRGLTNRSKGTKRKKQKQIIRINLILAAVVLLLLVVLLVKSCSGKEKEKEAEQELLENTNTFYAGIYVEDIALEGMTLEEAKTTVLQKMEQDCPWDMQVIHEDKVYEVEDILSHNLDEVLQEAYRLGRIGEDEARSAEIEKIKAEPVYLTVEDQYDAAQLDTIVLEAGELLDKKMTDADLTGYDEESGEFQYSEGLAGYELDQETLKEQIQNAIENKEYDAKIEAKMEVVEPAMDSATVKERVELMASFTTKTSNNSDRNENIRRASSLLHGVVIKPGKEFSMNEITGPRGAAEGYKPAGTIVNGKLVEEFGGGVCQVSTTLYNALVDGSLQTTERFSHSLKPSYVNPGEDSMISYSSADLKFENNSKSSVVILFRFSNNELTASVYGIPVLEEGVTVEMYSEQSGTIPMPKPVYEEDSSLKYGEEKVVTQGQDGSRYVTYLITKRDGVEISREFFHNSSYNPKTPVIRRNSKAKPTQSPTPAPTAEPEETELPGETELPEETLSPTPKPVKTQKPATPTPEPIITPEPTITDPPDTGEEEIPTEPEQEILNP